MAVELERHGIPTAVVSALGPVAVDLGANRVVKGVKIPHPCGDPTLDEPHDQALRRAIVERSLQAIATAVPRPMVFDAA